MTPRAARSVLAAASRLRGFGDDLLRVEVQRVMLEQRRAVRDRVAIGDEGFLHRRDGDLDHVVVGRFVVIIWTRMPGNMIALTTGLWR